MTQHVISGLIQKRAELAGELDRLRRDLKAIDGALEAFGYYEAKSIKPQNKRRRPALFAPGELTALVGEAERQGLNNNPDIARWIIAEKGLGENEYRRVRDSVKDLRKPSASNC